MVYKLSGSGNDFVFADGRLTPANRWKPEIIRQICDRRAGVGADGFAVLERGSGPGRVRFHFFNNDGSRAPMCGNGSLCATRIARWLEMVPTDEMVLETDAGEVHTRFLEGPEERSEFKLEGISGLCEPDIEPAPGEHSVHFLTVAVPHLVVVVDDVAAVPLAQRGRELRFHHALAPEGANVNFVSRGPEAWAMRTYERGVEGETFACATGAVSCAAVLCYLRQIDTLPWHVRSASGLTLAVGGRLVDGKLEEPSLIGESRLVFRAHLGT
ncbi:MAG: diaminopimelate epimerase [Gemmatimonadota bacterium]|nr:MAG: diaminopimelate epimerase [Gemmatimonadota bacterium]